MAETKAPRNKSDLDPVSESWRKLPWRKLEQQVYRIQKRIFKAEERGNEQAVRHLQKLLMRIQSGQTDSGKTGYSGQPGQKNSRDRWSEICPSTAALYHG